MVLTSVPAIKTLSQNLEAIHFQVMMMTADVTLTTESIPLFLGILFLC